MMFLRIFVSLIIVPCISMVALDENVDVLKYCAGQNDGSSFDQGCSSKCTCVNANGTVLVSCKSLCPPFISTDKQCYAATPNLECCKKIHCPSADPQKATCAQDFQNVPKQITNWNVRFDNLCVGTVIDEHTIYAPQGCYREGVVVSSPARLSNKKLKAEVVQGVGQSIKLIHGTFSFLPTFHSINLPRKAMCKKHCSLFVVASNVNDDGKLLIPAEKDKSCKITDGQSCLEMKNELSSEHCVNFGGSTVAVMEGDAFFLIGFLPPTDSAGLSERRCDKDLSSKRKYFDICSKIALPDSEVQSPIVADCHQLSPNVTDCRRLSKG
uniref:VWFD domain-containing protein n=1 Tax=Romanomermis culicivorax TaxID=13658 RepID=A0A915JQY5_ROMCU